MPANCQSRAGRGAAVRILPGSLLLVVSFVALVLMSPQAAVAQVFEDPFDNDVPGVWIDPDGHVTAREVDAKQQLNELRSKLKLGKDGRPVKRQQPGTGAAKKPTGDAKSAGDDAELAYVSIPGVLEAVRELRAAGKEIPDELKYLGGMTQVRYVLVDPDAKDLVIAGPAEPWGVVSRLDVRGVRTGRPVIHLDDLIVCLRDAYQHRSGGGVFGCRIDPDPTSAKKAEDVAHRLARASRKERIAALKAALPPQKVSVFGTHADSRLAFVLVAADYKLKRMAMGMEKSPVPGVGHAVDNTRTAANRFWFELEYEPLLTSRDGNAFELRGDRMVVKAGAFSFDAKGETPTARKFADGFNAKIAALSVAVPVYADLQNICDLAMVSSLIRRDGLDRRIGWDASVVMDAKAYPVEQVPVPKTADTMVGVTSGSLVAGGVMFNSSRFSSPEAREPDSSGALDGPFARARQLRKEYRDQAERQAVLATPGPAGAQQEPR